MAGLGDLGDKAKDFLSSDKGEKASDSALDKAGDAANHATGGKYEDQIEKGERAADDRIGN